MVTCLFLITVQHNMMYNFKIILQYISMASCLTNDTQGRPHFSLHVYRFIPYNCNHNSLFTADCIVWAVDTTVTWATKSNI